MAYQTPRTWAAGERPTAAQFNQDIRDNQLAAFPLGVAAWTSWTAAVVQGGAVTSTASPRNAYQRVGRLIVAQFAVSITGAGTAGQLVTVSLPVNSAATSIVTGVAWIYDASATTRYVCACEIVSASTVAFAHDTSGGNLFGQAPAVTLASGDLIRGAVTFEAVS